jgi:hypothetical protein
MGTRRKRRRRHGLWISAIDLPTTAAHPFYRRLNALLDEQQFDEFVKGVCRSLYAETMGGPSQTPGMYFRVVLVRYFEGIDAERGIAWRAANSLAIRNACTLPWLKLRDHSTISRTRQLIDLKTHRAVFTCLPPGRRTRRPPPQGRERLARRLCEQHHAHRHRHRQRRRCRARHPLPQGLHRVQRRADRRTARAVHSARIATLRRVHPHRPRGTLFGVTGGDRLSMNAAWWWLRSCRLTQPFERPTRLSFDANVPERVMLGD